MKKIIMILMLGTAFSANAQQSWGLKQCIDYALEHNISVKQYENQLLQQELQLSTEKNSRLPDLNASAGENFSFGRSLTMSNTYVNKSTQSTSFSLSTNVPLFTGFQIPNSIKLSKLNLEAATKDLEKTKNDVRLAVAKAYVQILYDMEIRDVALRQIAIDSAQVERLQARLNNGKASVAELSQQKSTLSQSHLTATQAENSLRLSVLSLTQLLELSSPEGFTVVRPVVSVGDIALPSPDAIYAEALGIRPEVQSAELKLKAAGRSVDIARSNLYPKLSFSAGLGSNYYNTSGATVDPFMTQMKNNFSQYLGFNLSYSIFDRFSTRNRIRSAKVDLQNQQLLVDNTKKSLYKEIQQVYYNTIGAQQKLKSCVEAQQSAADAFQLMQAKYEQGKATATEFNESKNNYLKTESNLTQARYELLYQRALVQFYCGQELSF